MEIKKILRLRGVTFVEDSIVKEHLEAIPSGRVADNGAIMSPSRNSRLSMSMMIEEDEDTDCTIEKIVKPKTGPQSKPSAVV